MGLELLAVLLTLSSAYFTVKGNKICWLLGIGSTAIYLYLVFKEHLYGQVISDIIILGQCFYGWLYWKANEDGNMTACSLTKFARDLVLMAISTAILTTLFRKFTNNPQPELDAGTTILALFANGYLAKKFINGYSVWISANILFIIMFFNQHMYWTVGLYVILIGFSIQGIIKYSKGEKNKQPYNKQGKPHGLWERYYSNGKLGFKGLFLNGLEEGPLESYYSNGQLCSKGDFLNDLAHGLWEVYHSNGQLHYKGLYLKGLREGLWESYWSNGQLFYKGNYIKGELIGYNQWNYSDGSIDETKFYAK